MRRLISTITFRVVDTGTAAVKFLDTSKVLLNDGQGTDALSQMTDGIYTLTVPPPCRACRCVAHESGPGQVVHGEIQRRSNGRLPEEQGDLSYVLDNAPATIPDNVSEGTATSVSYQNLADGVYYFHIKASSNAGIWGGTTHFAIEWTIRRPLRSRRIFRPASYTTDQDPIVTFQTTDAASGIDHYELKFISLDLPASTAA